MIFAMVMSVLIGTSTTAVHRIGLSARELEASLVADRQIADLEIQFRQKIAPTIDVEESVEGPYAIRVSSSAILRNLGVNDGKELGALGTSGSGLKPLLGPELPVVARHLKQYNVVVSWFEQDGVHSVNRLTFAFDWEAAAIEFSDLFSQGNEGTPTPDSEPTIDEALEQVGRDLEL